MQDKGIFKTSNNLFQQIIKPQEAQYTQHQCFCGGATHKYAPIQGGCFRNFWVGMCR